MTNHDDVSFDEDDIPLLISVAPQHMAHVERLAARHGKTAEVLLNEVAARVFGPVGGRLLR
jgi:hypothetical protein